MIFHLSDSMFEPMPVAADAALASALGHILGALEKMEILHRSHGTRLAALEDAVIADAAVPPGPTLDALLIECDAARADAGRPAHRV
jgi:hypothetical protein